MFTISKQLSCQKFIFKIHSSRLRRERWKLTLPVDEARRNEEIISLADSQILRWIDEINGVEGADEKAKAIKSEIKMLRKEPNSAQVRKRIRQLYSDLDKLQFKPDYMCLIIDKDKDYLRACKGFSINGVKYKRLLGTTGGVKNSTIVFVSENVVDELRRRNNNDRDMTKELVTAKLGAYMALNCSASVPVSFPKGILVVNDAETSFMSDYIYLASQDDGEPLMEFKENQQITINATDGFGLMLPCLAERWSQELGLDYVASGMCSRFSFEKGMVFTFDFLDFADKVAGGKYIVKDAWDNDVDIRNVELILTTSMVKLWDSYKSCEHYLECSIKNKFTFAVTKTCPRELENVRNLNYQFIQSYDLSPEDIDELIKPTMDEINDVLSGDWRRAAIFLKGAGLSEENVDRLEDNYAKALMIDQRMFNDPYIQSSIYQLIKNRINKAKVGVLKVHGNFSIVSGDPYLLCQSIFGLELTGLLKSGEIYSKYWFDSDAEKLACFRAPMTTHENIKIMKPCRSKEVSYWYQYMKTCTVLNAWDMTMPALNGLDYDGDMVFLTDNNVLVRKHIDLPAIMCAQKKAAKTIPAEEDFVTADINAFGNDIGSITNRATSMFEVRSAFEKGSREYDVLTYRIRCGQLLQQDAIDKAKGIVSKPMPREWYDYHAVNKIEDEEVRNFYRSVVADKKPYFMRYIYPALMSQYNTYIKNTDRNSLIEFGQTVAELKAHRYDELTERQKEFLRFYDHKMPVGVNDCVMNRICRKFEQAFDGFVKKNSKVAEFDYTIMKSDVEYSPKAYRTIKGLCEGYNKRLSNFSAFTDYERVDESDAKAGLDRINEEFVEECTKICPNQKELCNIMLDIYYSKSLTKRFVWSVCGSEIINNLLIANDNTISYPTLCDSGEVEYGGNRFTIETKKLEVFE